MSIEDQIAITELMNIARIYVKHGDFERAEKVLALVEQMQDRVKQYDNVADMDAWRFFFPSKQA